MDKFWYILTSTAFGGAFTFLTLLSDNIMVTYKHDDEKKKVKKSTGVEWEVQENSIFLEFHFNLREFDQKYKGKIVFLVFFDFFQNFLSGELF